MLQHEGTLQINSAMQTARQQEVSFEQSAELFESLNYVLRFQTDPLLECGDLSPL